MENLYNIGYKNFLGNSGGILKKVYIYREVVINK